LLLNSAETVQPAELSGVGAPADTSESRIKLGDTVTGAKIKFSVKTLYPLEARANGIEGTVRLHVIIAKDGSILQLEVISGHPLLTQAAQDAVSQWKYEPSLLNGQPVEVDTTIDVLFQLKKKQ
jgi:protein TonB